MTTPKSPVVTYPITQRRLIRSWRELCGGAERAMGHGATARLRPRGRKDPPALTARHRHTPLDEDPTALPGIIYLDSKKAA